MNGSIHATIDDKQFESREELMPVQMMQVNFLPL